MKLVRFLKGYQAYNSGETAGFLDEIAAQLIAARIAVDVADEGDPEAAHAGNPVAADPAMNETVKAAAKPKTYTADAADGVKE